MGVTQLNALESLVIRFRLRPVGARRGGPPGVGLPVLDASMFEMHAGASLYWNAIRLKWTGPLEVDRASLPEVNITSTDKDGDLIYSRRQE